MIKTTLSFRYCFTPLLIARVISRRELHVFTLASSRNSQLHTTRGTTVQSPIRYRSTLTDCTSVLYQQGIHWFYVPNLYSIKLLRHWDINYSLPGVDTGHTRMYVMFHIVSSDLQLGTHWCLWYCETEDPSMKQCSTVGLSPSIVVLDHG